MALVSTNTDCGHDDYSVRSLFRCQGSTDSILEQLVALSARVSGHHTVYNEGGRWWVASASRSPFLQWFHIPPPLIIIA